MGASSGLNSGESCVRWTEKVEWLEMCRVAGDALGLTDLQQSELRPLTYGSSCLECSEREVDLPLPLLDATPPCTPRSPQDPQMDSGVPLLGTPYSPPLPLSDVTLSCNHTFRRIRRRCQKCPFSLCLWSKQKQALYRAHTQELPHGNLGTLNFITSGITFSMGPKYIKYLALFALPPSHHPNPSHLIDFTFPYHPSLMGATSSRH